MTVTSERNVEDTVVYQALSDFGGKHYETAVYGRDLESVVKWEDGKELPISISSVKSTAQKAFQKEFPQFSKFKITSINLIHTTLIEDWIIQVEFTDTDADVSEDKRIEILVLLNGHAITPTETPK